MSQLDDRLAKLSPEKRKLLQLLAEQQKNTPRAHRDIAAESSTDSEIIQEDRFFSLQPGEFPDQADVVNLYDTVTGQLNASGFAEYALFLNWGYVANENPQYAQVKLPDKILNKNSIKLVLEVIGDCELKVDFAGLDVGCGRGGTISVIRQFFNTGKLTGIDLSLQAIAFCQRTHCYPNTEFMVGDAQALPLPDESVDFVTNIESSHTYPDIEQYYREVYRLLKPQGYFLYTDIFAIKRIDECLAAMEAVGLQLERQQDITSNVLLSCDDIADNHAKAFAKDNNQHVMSNFLGSPNSPLYNGMRARQYKYLLFKLRKITA